MADFYGAGYYERIARDPLNDRAPWRPSNGDTEWNRRRVQEENDKEAAAAELRARRILRALPIRLVLRLFQGPA